MGVEIGSGSVSKRDAVHRSCRRHCARTQRRGAAAAAPGPPKPTQTHETPTVSLMPTRRLNTIARWPPSTLNRLLVKPQAAAVPPITSFAKFAIAAGLRGGTGAAMVTAACCGVRVWCGEPGTWVFDRVI